MTSARSLLGVLGTVFVPGWPRPLCPSEVRGLARDRFIVVPHWLSARMVSALHADALALDSAGLSEQSAVGPSRFGSARLEPSARRSKQCPIFPPPPNHAGSASMRGELLNAVGKLRAQLQQQDALGLPELGAFDTELSYLLYPVGGHYRRHLDVPRRDHGWLQRGRQASDGGSFSGFSTRRVVSFLIYLNNDWDCEADGGQLQIFPAISPLSASPETSCASQLSCAGTRILASTPEISVQDQLASTSAQEQHILSVSPEGGTLVVFFSQEVEHVVCETQRERQCVVGWFRETRERRIPDCDKLSLRTTPPMQP